MTDKSDDTLRNKSIVITGGTTGIGRATAKLLTEHGGKCLIFGRDQDALREAMNETRAAHGLVADVSRQIDIERIFREADERIGGCDILINNAAVSGEKITESTYDDWRYILETNILGYIACTRQAIDRFKKSGRGGHIVNIGSMSADLREPGGEIYVATKAAIQGFSESLRKTLNKDGIRVSLIEPGAVATPIQQKTPDEEHEKIKKMEMLEPHEIAESVYYVLTQTPRCDVVMLQIRPTKQLI